MSVKKTVPSTSKVPDTATAKELTAVYSQIDALIKKVNELEEAVTKLKGN